MELGDDPEVNTAAKLAQTMAYQNKNLLQASEGLVAVPGAAVELWSGPGFGRDEERLVGEAQQAATRRRVASAGV